MAVCCAGISDSGSESSVTMVKVARGLWRLAARSLVTFGVSTFLPQARLKSHELKGIGSFGCLTSMGILAEVCLSRRPFMRTFLRAQMSESWTWNRYA